MSVSGEGPEAEHLRHIVRTVPEADNIGEFGIGLNGTSLRNGSFQEEKKARGNVHIAFGDNIYYGAPCAAPFISTWSSTGRPSASTTACWWRTVSSA